ncbi:alpha/beta-Hydrolases superfamily protein [Artemisia annua]|uniref:Alpha/beta-Hydrolases superfamily protein n=1 Tax=Artemisia annua TaxID=35608 RepID=A0A2U1M4L8_ARTAN|nr:alpha/beta-Hydrolases superfamily protein [Artemisia annua]
MCHTLDVSHKSLLQRLSCGCPTIRELKMYHTLNVSHKKFAAAAKIWAAGFATAILKRQNSAVNASSEAGEVQNGAKYINTDEKEPLFNEVLLLTLFEGKFGFVDEAYWVVKKGGRGVLDMSKMVIW